MWILYHNSMQGAYVCINSTLYSSWCFVRFCSHPLLFLSLPLSKFGCVAVVVAIFVGFRRILTIIDIGISSNSSQPVSAGEFPLSRRIAGSREYYYQSTEQHVRSSHVTHSLVRFVTTIATRSRWYSVRAKTIDVQFSSTLVFYRISFCGLCILHSRHTIYSHEKR